jgi:hypothetical protein
MRQGYYLPNTSQKTVTTTPTLLVTANRADQMVYLHSSSGVIYLGNSDVTTSTGYRMDSGDKLTLQLSDNEALYGVTLVATATMMVMATVN